MKTSDLLKRAEDFLWDGTEGSDPPLMRGTVEATVRVLAK